METEIYDISKNLMPVLPSEKRVLFNWNISHISLQVINSYRAISFGLYCPDFKVTIGGIQAFHFSLRLFDERCPTGEGD